MRYHFTPVRMAAIQKSTKNKCWRVCAEKGTLLHCWWKCKLVQPRGRTVWRSLKKLEIELPYDPAIALLGIHIEETRIERDRCTPMFIVTLFIIARTWKQPRCLDDADVLNSLLDSVGEGEGRMIWENGIETCKLPYVKRITSPRSMHETGCSGWCTGMTQRDGMGMEVGGGFRMGNT